MHDLLYEIEISYANSIISKFKLTNYEYFLENYKCLN